MSRTKGRSHAFNRLWINSVDQQQRPDFIRSIMLGLTLGNGARFVGVPQPETAEHPLVEKT